MFNNIGYLIFNLILSMGKQNKDVGANVGSRQKYQTWADDSTEFMLQWYIDCQKDKPASFKWKQQHHHMCSEALNARFGIGTTRQQVHRHFRAFKERWNWIKQSMDRSGYGFDAALCKFNIHYSEKSPSKLGVSQSLAYVCMFSIFLLHHVSSLVSR